MRNGCADRPGRGVVHDPHGTPGAAGGRRFRPLATLRPGPTPSPRPNRAARRGRSRPRGTPRFAREGRIRCTRAARSAKSPDWSPRPVSGSARWASNPADTRTQSGREALGERRDHGVERGEVDVARRARGQREVDGACRRPAPAPTSSSRPVPGYSGHSCNRHVHDVGVGRRTCPGSRCRGARPSRRSSTRPPVVAERGRGDRDVVEQAEAHRVVGLGVVTGRAHRAERGVAVARVRALRSPRARTRPRGRAASHDAAEAAVSRSRAPPPRRAERLELIEVRRRDGPARSRPGSPAAAGAPAPRRRGRRRGDPRARPAAGRALRMPATGIVLRAVAGRSRPAASAEATHHARRRGPPRRASAPSAAVVRRTAVASLRFRLE